MEPTKTNFKYLGYLGVGLLHKQIMLHLNFKSNE